MLKSGGLSGPRSIGAEPIHSYMSGVKALCVCTVSWWSYHAQSRIVSLSKQFQVSDWSTVKARCFTRLWLQYALAVVIENLLVLVPEVGQRSQRMINPVSRQSGDLFISSICGVWLHIRTCGAQWLYGYLVYTTWWLRVDWWCEVTIIHALLNLFYGEAGVRDW